MVNPERTQTLGGVIAAQMGSLQDLKIVTAAATGMLSSGGFVWLISDPHRPSGCHRDTRHGHAPCQRAATDPLGIYVPAETSRAGARPGARPPPTTNPAAPPPPTPGPPLPPPLYRPPPPWCPHA